MFRLIFTEYFVRVGSFHRKEKKYQIPFSLFTLFFLCSQLSLHGKLILTILLYGNSSELQTPRKFRLGKCHLFYTSVISGWYFSSRKGVIFGNTNQKKKKKHILRWFKITFENTFSSVNVPYQLNILNLRQNNICFLLKSFTQALKILQKRCLWHFKSMGWHYPYHKEEKTDKKLCFLVTINIKPIN